MDTDRTVSTDGAVIYYSQLMAVNLAWSGVELTVIVQSITSGAEGTLLDSPTDDRGNCAHLEMID